MSALILAGVEREVEGLDVRTWKDGPFSFYGKPGWIPSKAGRKIDLGVLHWSVTHTAKQCFDTLVQRGLSVQFILDADGTVYQPLDAREIAWHAHGVNDRSWGVEIVGGVPPAKPGTGVALDVRGDKSLFAPFTNEQVRAVVKLTLAVSDAFGIPLLLPRAPAGSPWKRQDGVSRDAVASVVTGAFRGTVAHFHVSPKKVDPGCSLWAPLRAAGFEVA